MLTGQTRPALLGLLVMMVASITYGQNDWKIAYLNYGTQILADCVENEHKGIVSVEPYTFDSEVNAHGFFQSSAWVRVKYDFSHFQAIRYRWEDDPTSAACKILRVEDLRYGGCFGVAGLAEVEVETPITPPFWIDTNLSGWEAEHAAVMGIAEQAAEFYECGYFFDTLTQSQVNELLAKYKVALGFAEDEPVQGSFNHAGCGFTVPFHIAAPIGCSSPRNPSPFATMMVPSDEPGNGGELAPGSADGTIVCGCDPETTNPGDGGDPPPCGPCEPCEECDEGSVWSPGDCGCVPGGGDDGPGGPGPGGPGGPGPGGPGNPGPGPGGPSPRPCPSGQTYVNGECQPSPPPDGPDDPCPKKDEVWSEEHQRCVCADDEGRPISDEPCCEDEDDCGGCVGEGGHAGCQSGNCLVGGKVGENGYSIVAVAGATYNGNSGASLVHKGFTLGEGSASPEHLTVVGSVGTDAILYDSNENLRQVLTGNRLSDVVTINPYTYEIRQYDIADKGSPDQHGVYQPTDTPLQVVRIENPLVGGTPDHTRLVVTMQEGTGAPLIDEYYNEPNTGAWRLSKAFDPATGKYARIEFKQKSWYSQPDQEWFETYTVYDGDMTMASRVIKKYKLFPWGKEQIEEIVETGLPGHSGYLSTWEFYTDPSETGRYSKLKTRVDERGYWTRYDYDTDGHEIKRVVPFKDSPVNAPDAAAHVYETSRSTDPVTGVITKTETEKILGQVVGLSYTQIDSFVTTSIVCLSPTASINDPSNLVTVSERYATGPLRRKEKLTLRPDGTMALVTYAYEGDILAVTRSDGAPNGSQSAIIDGTRTVTRTNKAGVVVESATYDIASNLQIAGSVVTEFDDFGRAVKTEYLDGSWESRVHGCCSGALSTTDQYGAVTTYTHDKLGRVLTETRDGITHSYIYDGEGRQLSKTRTGTNNSVIVLETSAYDLSGDRIWSKDTYDYITSYSHPNNNKRIHQVTQPDGSTVVTEHYLDGTQKSVSGTGTHPSAYDYLVEGNSRVTRAAAGTICTNCPNTEWTKSYTDMAGRHYKTLYADNAQALSHYNAKGQLWKSVDPDGVATLVSYDSRGRRAVTAVDMNRNDVIDYAGADRIMASEQSVVNDNGLVKIRQVQKQWQQAGVDQGTVIGMTEKSVASPEQWQSQFGLVTYSITTAGGNGTRVDTVVHPDGTSDVRSSAGGRTVQVVKLDANSQQIHATTYEYDAHGRLDAETDARNGTTNYTYYNNDQVESVILPAADATAQRQVRTFVYDTMGRVIETQLPDTSKTYNEYYPTGSLKRTWGSQAYDQLYTYDSQGRRKTLTTEGNRTTTWNYYSRRDWLSYKTYPDGSGPLYSYSRAGRLITRTPARHEETVYSHNNAGEVTYIYYTDDTPNVHFVINRRGLRERIYDSIGERHQYYNAAGQLSGEHVEGYVMGDEFDLMDYYKEFDSLLRPSSLYLARYQGKGQIHELAYTYDAASRLSKIKQSNNQEEFTYSYVPDSDLIESVTYKNKTGNQVLTTTRSYNNLDRVTSLETKRLSDNLTNSWYNYQYNSLNQRKSIRNIDNMAWHYDYDDLGQVISGQKKLNDGTQLNGYDFGYSFDGIGNRITATANGKMQQYTANIVNQYTQRTFPGGVDVVGEADANAVVRVNGNLTQQQGRYFHEELLVNNAAQPQYPLVTVTAETATSITSEQGHVYVPKTPEMYTYDWDGNLASDGRWKYKWDAENRLIVMETIASAPVAARKKMTFVYDYMGRRVLKYTHDWDASSNAWSAGFMHKYYYDGWNLIGEVDDDWVVQTYLWGTDLSGTMQGAGGVGGLLKVDRQPNAAPPARHESYAISDANGNVMKLVDAQTLDTVAEYEYGPFGELIRLTGERAKANPFRFSSKYQDDESGLLYYGYRYYDAQVGRWISRDPIEEEGGINIYSNKDFLSFVDLLGLYPVEHSKIVKPVKEYFVTHEHYTQRQPGGCAGSGPCFDKCLSFCSDKGGMQSNFIDHRWRNAYRILHPLLPTPKFIPKRQEYRSHRNLSGLKDVICNCTCKDQFEDIRWYAPKDIAPYQFIIELGTEPTRPYTFPRYPFDPGDNIREVPPPE